MTHDVATMEDVDQILADLREKDLEAITSAGGISVARDVMAYFVENSIAQVIKNDAGEAVAFFAAVPVHKGVYEVYGYTSNKVNRNPFGFHRRVRKLLAAVLEVTEAHKIECVVWKGNETSFKWLRRLGFIVEGFRLQHGPGKESAYLMGRIT